MNTLVSTTYGPVRGFTEDGVNKWLGIPYASPPVGVLRFRRAIPPEKWSEPLPCHRFGNKPIQFWTRTPLRLTGSTMRLLIRERFQGYDKIPESEDCLYLNVWRPDSDKKDLPVFVWIHGGGFAKGESSNSVYDGSAFARDDVVFISMNYRLGVLGFYDFTIYDEEHFDSNCGISDLIQALKWVHENVERFGGDPENVTIAGESAGGGCVSWLMAAPAVRGMFQKAIIQSGVPGFGVSADAARWSCQY